MLSAGNKVEAALDSAARSVLAGYHDGLAADSGIFALNVKGISANSIFYDYLSRNLEKNSLYRFEVMRDKTGIEGFNWLTGDNALRNQIIAYMKYRFPISAASGLVDRIKASGLSAKIDRAEAARDLRKNRSVIIDILNSLNSQISEVNSVESIDFNNMGELDSKLGSIGALADIAESRIRGYISSGTEEREAELNTGEFKNTLNLFSYLHNDIKDNLLKINKLRREYNDYISAEKNPTRLLLSTGHIGSSDKDKKVIRALPSEMLTKLTGLHWEEPVNNEQPPVQGDTGKKAAALLTGIYDVFKAYSSRIKDDWLIDKEEAKENEKLEKEMRVDMEGNAIFERDQAEVTNDGILEYVRRLTASVGEAAENGVESMYINEYIMTKFSYVTSRHHLGHFLEKGEVEYILFRKNSQLDNIRMTAQRIAFTRFAINSLDYFIASSNPHPMYRLLYSLSRGLMQTGRDMINLYSGRSIDILPSFSKASNLLKMNYADHLRLFLLLGQEEKKLEGIRQLFQINIRQYNENFELTDFSTAIEAKVKVRVNLWFIPLFIPNKLKYGPFEGNYYVVERKAYMGY